MNDGSPSGFSNQYTTSERTRASGPEKAFHVCAVDLPDSITIKEFGQAPDFIKPRQLLIHPDLVDDPLLSACGVLDQNAFLVEPTSSSRTVRICDPNGWYLKLAYNGLIGRVDRTLGVDQARSAVEVTNALSSALATGMLPGTFSFMREVFSRVAIFSHGSTPREWGFVVREPMPFPQQVRSKFLIPGFSLFARKHLSSDNEPSILTQLVEAQEKKPEDFVFEDLLVPLFDSYFSILLTCGLQLEAHAQNILFAVDENIRVAGLVARDAESIDRDISLMRDLGIHNTFEATSYKCLFRDQYNYQIMHSFMFDFKLGEYLVRPILSEAARSCGVDSEAVAHRIRDYNQRALRMLPRDFFPDGQWYSYDNVVHDRTVQRPYIAKPSPRYR